MDTKFCMARANEGVQPIRRTRATRNLCNTNRWLLTKTCAELTARTSVLHQRLVNKTQQTSAQSCEWTSWFGPAGESPADSLPPSRAKSITKICFASVSLICSPVPTTSMSVVTWPPVSQTHRACPGRPPHLLHISTWRRGALRNGVANRQEQPLALPEMPLHPLS